VETAAGTIACEEVVVGVGPWINAIWNMLELPKTIGIKGRDGKMHDNVPMWHYMALQEGTLGVDPDFQKTNDGQDAAGAARRHRRAALFRPSTAR
jgi:hypothetical protein